MTASRAPILVFDDHELVGSALVASLCADGLDARFVQVRSARGIVEAVARDKPGLVVLDLDLGRDAEGNRIDGVRLVGPITELGPRVVVLSGSSDGARIGAALDSGGLVWVPKSAPFPTLLAAIRAAGDGRSVMPPGKREQLIGMYRSQDDELRELRARFGSLTQREREVLAMLAEGNRAQAIAEHFVVSLATVRTQIRAVLSKLGVTSQLEAVALYRKAHG